MVKLTKKSTLQINKYEGTIDKLQNVRRELETFIFERGHVIKAALNCLIAKEHMLLVGLPGVAKSMVINQLVQRVSGAMLFETLMHPLVTDKDLFVSSVEIEQVQKPGGVTSIKNVYFTDGDTLANAQLVFLDEIYKSNPKTLNTLLTLLNERRFDLNKKRHKAHLMSAFFASNELPDISGDDGLAAFHDRILVRIIVDPLKEEVNQINVIKTQLARRRKRAAGNKLVNTVISLKEIEELQDVVPLVYVPEDVMSRLIKLAIIVSEKTDSYISQRRIERSVKLLQARALLDKRTEVSKSDLTLLRFTFWNDPDNYGDVEKLIRNNVLDPEEKEIRRIKSAAFELVRQAKKTVDDGDLWNKGINEELTGIMGCLSELMQLKRKNSKPHINDAIDKLRAEIIEAQQDLVGSQG